MRAASLLLLDQLLGRQTVTFRVFTGVLVGGCLGPGEIQIAQRRRRMFEHVDERQVSAGRDSQLDGGASDQRGNTPAGDVARDL
ncbi:hypothetical protein GALL_454840 [mine drainage metagenome]|uniref:Uncharacterized protein n=1 Tax=mine drainage metagenome TaxID=410659 RepID=A0A1J5PN05_9ZZZZ